MLYYKNKLLIYFFSVTFVLADSEIYKLNCQVPDTIIQSIKLTENINGYPFYIRTNSIGKLNSFDVIIKKYPHRRIDNLLIDCKSKSNCAKITNDLIANDIKNLDLGLFQINYTTLATDFEFYFDEDESYKKACEVLTKKIIHAGNWSWSVVANYHSKTPSLNEKYKKKVIRNYKMLTKKTFN